MSESNVTNSIPVESVESTKSKNNGNFLAGLGIAGGLSMGVIILIVGVIIICCICCIFTLSFALISQKSTTIESNNIPVDTNNKSNTITFKGNTNKKTEKFSLKAGTAKIVVKTSSSAYKKVSSFILMNDSKEDVYNNFAGNSIVVTSEPKEEGYAEKIVNNLPEGTYYISVVSYGDWSIEITQE